MCLITYPCFFYCLCLCQCVQGSRFVCIFAHMHSYQLAMEQNRTSLLQSSAGTKLSRCLIITFIFTTAFTTGAYASSLSDVGFCRGTYSDSAKSWLTKASALISNYENEAQVKNNNTGQRSIATILKLIVRLG